MPFLETPSENPTYGKHYIIKESATIMDFLEEMHKDGGIGPLYSSDPFTKAEQRQVMTSFDGVHNNLFAVMLSRGSQASIIGLQKAFDKLNLALANSSTPYFNNAEYPQMPDLFGFPHTSRIFYLKGSALDNLYNHLEVETKWPYLTRWFKKMRTLPYLNDGQGIIPERAF